MLLGFFAPGGPSISNMVLKRAAERGLLTLMEKEHRGAPEAWFLWATSITHHARDLVLILGVNKKRIKLETILSQQCFLCARKSKEELQLVLYRCFRHENKALGAENMFCCKSKLQNITSPTSMY